MTGEELRKVYMDACVKDGRAPLVYEAALLAVQEAVRAECAALVPTNWLDELLTGPKAVLPGDTYTYHGHNIEGLLLAIKKRIEAKP